MAWIPGQEDAGVPRYERRHIATDPLHIKREPRYAVVDRATGETVATHEWAQGAKDDARRRSIEAGACQECGGEGSIIVDWDSGPDGDVPLGEGCPRCGGSGVEPVTNAEGPR